MSKQKISLKNIHNFIKYIGPKIDVSLIGLIVDFEKSNNGILFIDYESDYQKEKISFCVSKNSFKIIVDGKEKDFSNEWQKYLADSYSTDMDLYYQHEGSTFGWIAEEFKNRVIILRNYNKTMFYINLV